MSRRSPDPKKRTLELASQKVEFAHHDQTDKRVYFAAPGTLIPKRSDYLLGTAIGLGFVMLWGVFFGVAIVLQWIYPGRDMTPLGLAGPAIAGVILMMVLPFVRRRLDGRDVLNRLIREGKVVEVRESDLAKRLMKMAKRQRRGYFEQAEQLARVDALRTQAEQLAELSESAHIAGPRHASMADELRTYERRLIDAASDREQLVWNFCGGRPKRAKDADG